MDTHAIPRDEVAEVAEMAIAIIQATDDGDKLSPSDLVLVELAVNGMLNPDGVEAFRQLHHNATKPEGYTVPFLFDIEHLTIDHDRFIRWKGVTVEHFDHGVWRQPGWRDRMRDDAEKVAETCRLLEAEGIQPTTASVLARRDPIVGSAKADSKSDQQPSAPETEPAAVDGTRGKPLALNTLYWGENDSHEFWESEDHELLILRTHEETWWSVLRRQRFQFSSQTASDAAIRLNVALCPDKLWKKTAPGIFALEDRDL